MKSNLNTDDYIEKSFTDYEKEYYDFYAPSYEILVGGSDIVKKNIEVVSLSVDSTISGASQFSFTVSNTFDVVDKNVLWIDDVLSPGKDVSISMGYTDKLKQVFYGLITSVKVDFPASGLPQLEVSGYDLSHYMMKSKESKPWGNTEYGDIIKKIASRYKSYGLTDEEIKISGGKPKSTIKQDQQTDYEFLEKLANSTSCEFFISGKKLYFRKKPVDGKAVLTLEWGKNLFSFSPELNIAQQVTEVEVVGWDANNKKEVIGKAKASDISSKDGGKKSGSEIAEKVYGEKAVIKLHKPVHSKEEADELARAELTNRNNKLLKGSGECIGIPEILPGRFIKLSGMGSIFSRPYYINSSRHSINSSGYKTTFTVEGNSL